MNEEAKKEAFRFVFDAGGTVSTVSGMLVGFTAGMAAAVTAIDAPITNLIIGDKSPKLASTGSSLATLPNSLRKAGQSGLDLPAGFLRHGCHCLVACEGSLPIAVECLNVAQFDTVRIRYIRYDEWEEWEAGGGASQSRGESCPILFVALTPAQPSPATKR